MCYYNRLIVPVSHAFELGDWQIALPDGMTSAHPMQSGFEYGDWPIIIWSDRHSRPEPLMAHWEFIAPWSRTMKEVETGRQKYTTLNAIGENLLDSRLYRDAALHRRCLVPSSGFYEWRHWKPAGVIKELAVPYLVYLPGKPVFYMAGIWQNWTDQETGEHLTSFALVTTAANALMAQVHNKKKRMPLVLPDKLAMEWIQPGLSKERLTELVHYQYDSASMTAITIKKDFRTATDPVEPFRYEGLPELKQVSDG